MKKCNCWVSECDAAMQFTTRYGAHGLSCPVYRPSLDELDAKRDVALRTAQTEQRKGHIRVVQYADRWVAECTACSKIGEGNNPTSAHGSVAHRDGCCGAA